MLRQRDANLSAGSPLVAPRPGPVSRTDTGATQGPPRVARTRHCRRSAAGRGSRASPPAWTTSRPRASRSGSRAGTTLRGGQGLRRVGVAERRHGAFPRNPGWTARAGALREPGCGPDRGRWLDHHRPGGGQAVKFRASDAARAGAKPSARKPRDAPVPFDPPARTTLRTRAGTVAGIRDRPHAHAATATRHRVHRYWVQSVTVVGSFREPVGASLRRGRRTDVPIFEGARAAGHLPTRRRVTGRTACCCSSEYESGNSSTLHARNPGENASSGAGLRVRRDPRPRLLSGGPCPCRCSDLPGPGSPGAPARDRGAPARDHPVRLRSRPSRDEGNVVRAQGSKGHEDAWPAAGLQALAPISALPVTGYAQKLPDRHRSPPLAWPGEPLDFPGARVRDRGPGWQYDRAAAAAQYR